MYIIFASLTKPFRFNDFACRSFLFWSGLSLYSTGDENNILIVDNKLDISSEVLLLLNETNIQLEDILNEWDLIEF